MLHQSQIAKARRTVTTKSFLGAIASAALGLFIAGSASQASADQIVKNTVKNVGVVNATSYYGELRGVKKFFEWSGTQAAAADLFGNAAAAGVNSFTENFAGGRVVAPNGKFTFASRRENNAALAPTGRAEDGVFISPSSLRRNGADVATEMSFISRDLVKMRGGSEWMLVLRNDSSSPVTIENVIAQVDNSDGSISVMSGFSPDGTVAYAQSSLTLSPMGSPGDTFSATFLGGLDDQKLVSLTFDSLEFGDRFFEGVAVPEPSSISLLLVGFGLAAARRIRGR